MSDLAIAREHRITVRALLLGDRIETAGLERNDVLSTLPLAFRAGEKGIVALFRYGVAVLVGMSAAAEQSLPVATIQSREINLTGTFRYANTYPTAVAFVSSGQINPDAIVGARFPLDQAEQALKMGHTDPSVVKSVVVVSE